MRPTLNTKIVKIDNYGGAKLDISSGDFLKLGFEYADLCEVTLDGKDKYIFPVVPNYRYIAGDALGIAAWPEPERPLYLLAYYGNFARCTGAQEGMDVVIKVHERQGYAHEYSLRDLRRTNVREDYLTDEIFANFRAVTKNVYRASSPIDPVYGRNRYSDALCEKAGIMTIVNLTDSEEQAKGYPGYNKTYYSRQNILFCHMNTDFTQPASREKLRDAYRFIANNEGPFLVHCVEGQDRTGFFCAILECLAGKSYTRIIRGYMQTYDNYYGVEKGSEQYFLISVNLLKSLEGAFGSEEIQKPDLTAEAERYLRGLGLTKAEIKAIKEKI